MRTAVLEENLRSCELESRASREAAARLAAELDRERRKSSSSAEALSSAQTVINPPRETSPVFSCSRTSYLPNGFCET